MFRHESRSRDTGIVNTPVNVRHYVEDDLEPVLALCVEEDWPSYPADPVRANGVFNAPGVVSVVAEVDNRVVGFAYCQTDGAIQAHVSLLVVAASHRREGIAKGLLDFAFRHVGAGRMDLVTDDAQDFYRSLPHREKSGFRIYPHDD
jgi:ribosomal protein S18 acetylase RimI-like enzyme